VCRIQAVFLHDLRHGRLQKHIPAETLKLVVPAHRPIKRLTLAHRPKQARLSVEDFLALP
jgi:hypothetical protein